MEVDRQCCSRGEGDCVTEIHIRPNLSVPHKTLQKIHSSRLLALKLGQLCHFILNDVQKKSDQLSDIDG